MPRAVRDLCDVLAGLLEVVGSDGIALALRNRACEHRVRHVVPVAQHGTAGSLAQRQHGIERRSLAARLHLQHVRSRLRDGELLGRDHARARHDTVCRTGCRLRRVADVDRVDEVRAATIEDVVDLQRVDAFLQRCELEDGVWTESRLVVGYGHRVALIVL